jgi:hypothetical protein
VGLLTAYSNRSDLLHELSDATSRLERAGEEAQPSVRSVRSPNRQNRALSDRLSDAERYQIVAACEAGELQRVVAERHHLSVRSVRRLLRQYRQRPDAVV